MSDATTTLSQSMGKFAQNFRDENSKQNAVRAVKSDETVCDWIPLSETLNRNEKH